ncbi:HDOD domain-containing protein [Methylomonas methanica]|uniref:Putative signal transduction protein n=1 Tax=Methylomonas methanica (strain DSM 25384 / MC09) TaxID=857087 RepID=G0A027_METMM|nr:HDOD domain-containing protein [Methylomonas methanica]AEG01166.1 putative signal transduction protein [Methylomonas methanica MC09]
MPIQMTQLFDNIPKLPQIPEVVRTIINQLNDPHAEMLDIAKNVEKEQVISLKILRLVNSAHFGLSRKISSIDEATVMLGMNQLKTLVIASGIVSSIPNIANFDIKKFWNNCFRTAVYAKWFAEHTHESGDIAYTAGLIGNLGNLLIHMGLPSEANEIDQHARAGHSSRAKFERTCLGFTNQEVCAELCRRWKFGDELVQAIQQSGEPLSFDAPSPIACCLHLAQFISDAVDRGKTEAEILAALPYPVTEKIGLSEGFFNANLAELLSMKSNLEGLAD